MAENSRGWRSGIFAGFLAGILVWVSGAVLTALYALLIRSNKPDSQSSRENFAYFAFALLLVALVSAIIAVAFAIERKFKVNWLLVLFTEAIVVSVLGAFILLPVISAVNSCSWGVGFPINNHACR